MKFNIYIRSVKVDKRRESKIYKRVDECSRKSKRKISRGGGFVGSSGVERLNILFGGDAQRHFDLLSCHRGR
jgi:hypothetical protein